MVVEVNREDLAGALKRVGANRVFIDSQDYEMVLQQEFLDPHVHIDDQDLPQIVGALIADVTPPALSSLSPLDDAVGVAVGVVPAVTFDTPIEFSLLVKNFTLKTTIGDTVVETWQVDTEQGSGAGQCEIVGNAVLLHLTAPLTAATEYYIIWDAGVVHDLVGNDCAAQASTTAWSFTTA